MLTVQIFGGSPLKKRIEVVGAVVVRDGEVLCAKRGDAAKLAGLWEFPGGKIEVGETPEEALTREIFEELDCQIEVGKYINTAEHEYDFGVVVLSSYFCRLLEGEPKPNEHEELRWSRPEFLDELEWAPADLPAVAAVMASMSS